MNPINHNYGAITYFEKQRDELLSRLNEADTIVQLNQQLHRFNWMFVHSHLFGGDLSRLQERVAKVETTIEQITAVFADAFMTSGLQFTWLTAMYSLVLPFYHLPAGSTKPSSSPCSMIMPVQLMF